MPVTIQASVFWREMADLHDILAAALDAKASRATAADVQAVFQACAGELRRIQRYCLSRASGDDREISFDDVTPTVGGLGEDDPTDPGVR